MTNDGSANAGQTFEIGQSKFGWFDQITQSQFDTNNNTDGFHVFRLSQDVASGTTTAWRDGVLVGSYSGYFYNYGVPEFYWGDGSVDLGGPTVLVDYVRFTPGTYEPMAVPEPSSCVLLALGGVGLAVASWQKRRRS